MTTDTHVNIRVPQQILDTTMDSDILTAEYCPCEKGQHFQRCVHGGTCHSHHLSDTDPQHGPLPGLGVTGRGGHAFHRKCSRLQGIRWARYQAGSRPVILFRVHSPLLQTLGRLPSCHDSWNIVYQGKITSVTDPRCDRWQAAPARLII